MSETTDRPLGEKLKRGVESKILVPIATAIVSAATSYLIKKLPLILEEKLLPKLREKDAPEPVVHALEQTASTLTGNPVEANGSDPGDAPEKQEASKSAMSNDEREEQRREREERRRERKRAATKAA